MHSRQFSAVKYSGEIDRLRRDLYHTIAEVKGYLASTGLTLPLSTGSPHTKDQSPLTIALVGQYNAGKSTIIRALTMRSDIKIDSDICTDKTEVYDWQGVQLIDTPGIHAGRADHDAITYDAIDRADLIIFVITNEMFDNWIGSHFRRLAFERQKARELMLVVNKMSQDGGDPTLKRRDLERVTQPLAVEELYTCFIDAESYLDAQSVSDHDDRRELTELSAIHVLISNMERFIADRGLLAKFTTPVFELRRIADEFANYFSVDEVEERMVLELLYRKRALLVQSRARIEMEVRSELAQAAVEVNTLGDRLAESVRPGITEAEFDQDARHVTRRAEDTYARIASRIETVVEDEVERLRRDVDRLGSSPLSLKLKKLIQRRLGPGAKNGESGRAEGCSIKQNLNQTAERLAGVERAGAALKLIGKMVTGWTRGPSEGAGLMSATTVAGSPAHEFVYNVGKFFGVEFAPWGAVHTAQIIGKIGGILGAVGGVLCVVAQASEDIRNEEMARELRRARDSVRETIRQYVKSVEAQFWERYKALESELYERELAAVDESEKTIVGQRASRSDIARRFQALALRASDLIRRIQRAGELAAAAAADGV